MASGFSKIAGKNIENLLKKTLLFVAESRYNEVLVGWGYFLSSLPPRPPAHLILDADLSGGSFEQFSLLQLEVFSPFVIIL